MLKVEKMTRPKTVYDWFREHEEGAVDMAPGYGRGTPPWPEERRALLVNSVLRGWDMPKFYVADFTYGVLHLSEKRTWYGVVDGRRRFEALFDFLRGELALDATPIPASGLRTAGEGQDLVLEGATMRDLMMRHPGLAARFERHVPTVMSVISDSREQVEELMRRLGHPRGRRQGRPRAVAADGGAGEAGTPVGRTGA